MIARIRTTLALATSVACGQIAHEQATPVRPEAIVVSSAELYAAYTRAAAIRANPELPLAVVYQRALAATTDATVIISDLHLSIAGLHSRLVENINQFQILSQIYPRLGDIAAGATDVPLAAFGEFQRGLQQSLGLQGRPATGPQGAAPQTARLALQGGSSSFIFPRCPNVHVRAWVPPHRAQRLFTTYIDGIPINRMWVRNGPNGDPQVTRIREVVDAPGIRAHEWRLSQAADAEPASLETPFAEQPLRQPGDVAYTYLAQDDLNALAREISDDLAGMSTGSSPNGDQESCPNDHPSPTADAHDESSGPLPNPG